MIELRKLVDKYPTSVSNFFLLNNLFFVALEQLGESLEEITVSGDNMLVHGKLAGNTTATIDNRISHFKKRAPNTFLSQDQT